MIKVKYYYSACVAITTPDISILCDPWFTDGIYDDACYTYPKIKRPIDLIGKHDLIYISHIHPNHYDPRFLKEYLEKYPDTKIIIAPDIFLDKKMEADGIPYFTTDDLDVVKDVCWNHMFTHHVTKPNWEDGNELKTIYVAKPAINFKGRNTKQYNMIAIIKNDTLSLSDIDTALLVKYFNLETCVNHYVLNMNGNAYNEDQLRKIKSLSRHIDITLLSPTEEKKQDFFERYKKMAAALDAKVNIPFGGQYLLGGKLNHLNQHRGVCDAVDILNYDPKAIVLAEGASIDTKDFKPTAVRTQGCDEGEMSKLIKELV